MEKIRSNIKVKVELRSGKYEESIIKKKNSKKNWIY